MPEFYRFRDVNTLLGDRQELEKQSIFFASPKQLNDPQEGFRDIFWHGDHIIWNNLFRHYLICLTHAYLHIVRHRDSIPLSFDALPVRTDGKQFICPEDGPLLEDVYAHFSARSAVADYIQALGRSGRRVRRPE